MLLSAPRSFCSAALALGALLGVAARAAESVAAAPRMIPDLAYLAPDRAEKLDLYLPVAPAKGKLSPAVVWIHGGGWTGGVKTENRAKEICTTLAAAGYVAVSVDYKLGDGAWPTNLHDCKNAVRFLRAHAATYQLDPDRIAVAGGSAGGHLALMVGFTGDLPEFEPAGAATPYPGVSSQVRAVIDLYGPANLLTRQEVDEKGTPTGKLRPAGPAKVFGTDDPTAPVYRRASPVTHVTKNSPPVLILHGRIDTTVDRAQSEELAGVLQHHGVPHEIVMVEGAGHTFDFETWNKKPLSRDLRPVALAFLAKYLGR
jgi:acetyl esterase/lipase